jgi:predicted metalloprotease
MESKRPGGGRSGVRRLGLLTLAVAGLAVLALAGAWAWGRRQPAPDPAPAMADRTDAIMRRTEAAFADAQALWRRAAGDGSGGRYDPARAVFFSAAATTPCAPGATVAGPFYCPETGTAAFDLAFLAVLAGRLQRQEDLGLALVAVRISAEHLQRETGMLDAAALRLIGAGRRGRAVVDAALELQADCLTGVWAAAAGDRLGPVPAPFWGQLVWSWRNVVDDLGARGVGVPPEFDIFASASREAREDAFAQGYAGGAVAACPPPGEIVARG